MHLEYRPLRPPLGDVNQYMLTRLAVEEQKEAYRESYVQVCSDLQFDESHGCLCIFWLYYRDILIQWEHASLLIF
jgi:hypothetical protein